MLRDLSLGSNAEALLAQPKLPKNRRVETPAISLARSDA